MPLDRHTGVRCAPVDDVARKLAEVGALLCDYCVGDPDSWINGRCDCKYGLSGRGEQNGCAEVRSIYRMLTDPNRPKPWWSRP